MLPASVRYIELMVQTASAAKGLYLTSIFPCGTNRMQDWGQTNYHIVRNWATPGNKPAQPTNSNMADAEQPALNFKRTSNAEQFGTKSSTTKGSTRGMRATVKGETSYRLRRSTSGRGQDTTWFVPDVYSTSKKGPRRTSILDGSVGEKDDRIPDAVGAGCIREQGHICSLNMSVSESSNHLLSLSRHQSSKRMLSSSPEKEQAPFPDRNTEHTGEIEREDFAHSLLRRDTEGSEENRGKEVIQSVQRRNTRISGEPLSQPVRRRKSVRGRKSEEQVHVHVSEPVLGKKSEIEGERVIVWKNKTNGSMVGKQQNEDCGGFSGDESGMEVVEATGNEQLDGDDQVGHDDVDMDAHHLSPSEAFPG